MSFSFPTVKIGTIDISDAEMDRLENQRAFVNPGEHSLKIIGMTNNGPSKDDSTFINVQVDFEATNGGNIRDYFDIPTTRLRFMGTAGKKGELKPFQKLCKFFEALGENPRQNDVPALINKYFAKNTLSGRTVKVVVGFWGNHIARIDNMFALADRDGTPFLTDTGALVASGSDRDTAKAVAVALGFEKLQEWPKITRYIPETTDEAAPADDIDF